MFGRFKTSDRVKPVDIETLKRFNLLGRLNEKQLILLESRHEVRVFQRNRVIFEAGSSDNIEYFLLDGEVELTAKDGKSFTINANTPAAKHAIAHLQPRQYQVKTKAKSQLILIDWSVLAQLVRQAPKTDPGIDEEAVQSFSNSQEYLFNCFKQDLASNNFTLPSLPDVALRINQSIDWDECSGQGVAKAVTGDPAMAVKLISAANSPLIRGMSSIKTCEEAVFRLGMETTQRLVWIFALRELFDSKEGAIKTRMKALWAHCVEVAAIAYLLAKYSKGLSPDEAMLAGLIHDIGVIPVLVYADANRDLLGDDSLDDIADALKGEAGRLMLEQWDWSPELINAVVHAENWHYESAGDEPDYTDLVILAQLHAAIDKPEETRFPALDSVPSFNKLKTAELTPENSLKIIAEAREELEEAKSLLQMV